MATEGECCISKILIWNLLKPHIYIYIYTAPWVLQFGYANWSSLSHLFFLNPCHLCLGSFKFGASGRGPTGGQWGGMVGETGIGGNGLGMPPGRLAVWAFSPWAAQGMGVPGFQSTKTAGCWKSPGIFMDFNEQAEGGRIHPRIYFCQSPWEHDLWISQVEGRIPVYQSAWGALGRASRIEFVAFACGGTPVFALQCIFSACVSLFFFSKKNNINKITNKYTWYTRNQLSAFSLFLKQVGNLGFDGESPSLQIECFLRGLYGNR